MGHIYVDSFDIFVEAEPVITKLERKRERQRRECGLQGGNTSVRESGGNSIAGSEKEDRRDPYASGK